MVFLTGLITTGKGVLDKLSASVIPLVVIFAGYLGYLLLLRIQEVLAGWLILTTVVIGLSALMTVPYVFFD
jgi:hypothetical protein